MDIESGESDQARLRCGHQKQFLDVWSSCQVRINRVLLALEAKSAESSTSNAE